MPDVWKHMPGHPGYFVTKAGDKQVVMVRNGRFAIMGTRDYGGGRFEVLSKTSDDPVKLGIPQELADEGEMRCVDAIVDRAKAGETVAVSLGGDLGGDLGRNRGRSRR